MAEQEELLAQELQSAEVQPPKTPKHTKIGKALKKDMKKNWAMYLLLLPAVVFFAIFCYAPMVGLLMAFQDFDLNLGFFHSPWVGFKHFVTFFNDMYFWRLLGNTLLFSLYDILFVFTTPILLALLINGVKRRRYRRVILTAVYLPYFISTVVVCGIISSLVDTNGIFGIIFTKLGLLEEGMSMLGDPRHFRAIIIVSNIWQTVGFNSVIYVAALGGIDPCLYEAAELDGANWFKKVLHISLPAILPTIMMMLIMKIGMMLNVNFEKIYLLYSTPTYNVGEVISTYIYRYGAIGGNYSYTTAIGLFQSVFGFILLLIANWLSRKFTSSSVF